MHDVVVVGAGIAGLSLTHALLGGGWDVRCVEATDRTGGRLLSVPAGGGVLDLGATWFWPGEARVERLARSLGVETFAQYASGDAMYDLADGVRRLQGNPLDPPAYRYRLGAQALADALAAALPPGVLTLSSPVHALTAEGHAVVVEGTGFSARAAHAVMCLPPALAISAIGFGPALPPSLESLARSTPVWMGATSKIVVEYPTAFWREAGQAGSAVSQRGPLWEIHDISGPDGRPAALFGFATPAPIDGPVGAAQATEEVLAQLVRLFGPAAGSPVRMWTQDWSREPYTSPPDVATRQDVGLFGHRAFHDRAWDGRLHWACTETSRVNPGHVEGALAAAEQVARRIATAPTGRRANAGTRETLP